MRPTSMFLLLCAVALMLSTYGDAFNAPHAKLNYARNINLPHTPHKGQRDRQQHEVNMAISASQAATVNKAAIKAISKLLATCGIGVLSSKAKILDQTALSVLSRLIFSVFQPCLLFVNVASTVASLGKTATGSSAAIYLLPLAAIFQIVVGFLTGKIVSFLIYGKSGAESESAKQLQACTTFGNSGPLPLVFTDGLFRAHPNPALLQQSVAYISLYLLGWSPLFWIIGPAILQKRSLEFGSKEDGSKKRQELLKRIFSPPVIGSLLGMVVGFVPLLRNFIIAPQGLLNPVYEAMRTLGAAYLPAVLLVLAGSLSTSAPAEDKAMEKKDSNLLFDIMPIYLARFLLMPAIGFGLLLTLMKTSPWLKQLFASDPMLLLVLLLETCMPSAQNTTVILQLQGEKSAAGRLARKLMLIYVLGVPAITFWLIKILSITNLA